MNKLKAIWCILTNKKPPAIIKYKYISKLKMDDIPKGEWVYVSTGIVINVLGDYWMEGCKIVSEFQEVKFKSSEGTMERMTITDGKGDISYFVNE